MLFDRRIPETLVSKLRNWIWPKQGWGRTLRYYKYRVVRVNDSSYSLAAGLAIGCAISFTPAFGTHIIQSALLCWIFRANWFAAVVGTIFGNPFTFPFLWSISTFIGISLFKLFGLGWFLEGFYFPATMEEIWDLPVRFLIPVMVGGYITGIVSYPLFYYPFRSMIRTARILRNKRTASKVHKEVKNITGQEE